MSVFGAVIDQEQQLSAGQALNEGVQQRLSFSIEPVQILKHQHKRLSLAFTEEDPLDRIECLLPALLWSSRSH